MRIKRWVVQLLSTIACNSYIQGFLQSTIYQGKLKAVCVPGLNCYSCPGALGACPIGSLQGVLGSKKYNFSLYVLGFLLAFGILFGRFICGFLCPFGFLQDLLYRIRSHKAKHHRRLHRVLKYLKYLVLAIFVIVLPIFYLDSYGVSTPYFCKLICPVGTLEGGIPLVIGNPSIRSLIGGLFAWKMTILVAVIVACIFIYRVFCKYICPLGAIYSLFNKISFYKISIDQDKCTKCRVCNKVCKMHVDVMENPNGTECIRCGDCRTSCPHSAISMGFGAKR